MEVVKDFMYSARELITEIMKKPETTETEKVFVKNFTMMMLEGLHMMQTPNKGESK